MTPQNPSPQLLLFGLLGLLGVSLVYPQAAYPLLGAGLGALLWGIGILVLLRWQALRRQPAAGGEIGKPAAISLVLAAAWSAWWLIGWVYWAEVPVLGTAALVTAAQTTCLFALVVFLIPLLPKEWRPLPLVSGWLVVAGALISIHAAYQVFGPEWMPHTFASRVALIEASPGALPESTREGILHALREGRASGVFGSPNVLAGFLAMVLPLALVYCFRPGRQSVKIACAVVAILLLVGIVLTGSRGGLLAAVVGIAATLGLIAPRLFIRAAPVALLAVVLLGAASSPGFIERWTGVSTVQQRFLYWDAAIAIWTEAPLIGRGPGGFELHYPLHRDPMANETRFAHSWFFQWGAEVGFVGLLLFGAWMGVVLTAGFQRWRAADSDLIIAGLIAALLVLLVHGLVEFTLNVREIALHMALIAALLVSGGSIQTSKHVNNLGAGGAILCIGILASIWMWCQYNPAQAASYRERVGYESAETDIRYLSRALQLQPNDPSLWEARAFARHMQGLPGSLDDMEQAIRLNPYSSRLHESLGRLKWARGEHQAAMDLQRDAIRLHPADPDRRLLMAEYLLQTGDRDGAKEMIDSTDGLLWTRTQGLAFREELLIRIQSE